MREATTDQATLTRFSAHHIACSSPYLSPLRHSHHRGTSFLLLPELHHCWEQLWHQDAVDPMQRTNEGISELQRLIIYLPYIAVSKYNLVTTKA